MTHPPDAPGRTCRRALSALAAGLLAAVPAFAADAPAGPACRDDLRAHCASVQPGGGRMLACLQQHEKELSPACRSALPTFRQCAQEIRGLCGSADAPRALRACLRENAAKLGPECRHRPAR